MLGLTPPLEVLAVLLKQIDAGDVKVQRAHVDELLSSKFVAED
jgi:DNA polymerase delta subunit 4